MISDVYAAGFFDGEGTVGAYLCTNKSNGKTYKALTYNMGIMQGSPFALIKLRDKYGGDLRLDKWVKSKFSDRDFWRWTIRGKDSDGFVEAILPHSIEKREQLLAYQEIRKTIGKRFGAGKLSEEVWRVRERLVKRLRDLKRVCHPDVEAAEDES